MKPGMACEPSGRIQSRVSAKLVRQVVGVGEVGGEVEPVVGLLLEVGDAGDVGALAGLELDRQLLLDHLVGDVVEDDVDAGVLGHEALRAGPR